MGNVRACIDFLITQKCNYRCAYCSQSKKFYKNQEHATDETIEAFFRLLKNLDKSFEITISGGEPLTHPRFYEVLEEIKRQNLKLTVVSNFSYPIEYYTGIVDIMGENLSELFVSYHSTQVKDFDEFKQKIKTFNSQKPDSTRFSVASVVTEENLDKLQSLAEFLTGSGVNFCPQHMRIKNSYFNYSKDAAEFLANHAKKEPGHVINTFGKMCFAGCKFLLIYENGEAYRCYSSRFNKSHQMGNIKDKNFKLYDAPNPCTNTKCTCPKPISYNMLDFKRTNYPKAALYVAKNAVFLPGLMLKNFEILRAKFEQYFTFLHKN